MSLKHVMELFEEMDSIHVTGEVIKSYLEKISDKGEISVQTVEGKAGSTDFVKVFIPGTNGKRMGGTASTLGIVGRLGGIGARPEVKGFVSDGDGALSAMATAAKLLDMQAKGDQLEGDVILTTHICPTAPTSTSSPVARLIP